MSVLAGAAALACWKDQPIEFLLSGGELSGRWPVRPEERVELDVPVPDPGHQRLVSNARRDAFEAVAEGRVAEPKRERPSRITGIAVGAGVQPGDDDDTIARKPIGGGEPVDRRGIARGDRDVRSDRRRRLRGCWVEPGRERVPTLGGFERWREPGLSPADPPIRAEAECAVSATITATRT